MACGRAVICANCKTGPKELTVNGIYGRLVPVEDVAALANEIIRLGDDEDYRTQLGLNARAHIERNYDKSVLGYDLRRIFAVKRATL